MRALFIVTAILAIVPSIGAQVRPPNAVPPTNSEGRGVVEKLNATHKANKSEQSNPTERQIISCSQTSPCYVIEQPQAKSEEQKAKDNSLDVLNRRYMQATIWGVIGAFIGLGILIWQTVISRTAANAAKASADAMIIGERAWVVAELIPVCRQFGNWWHRPAGDGWAIMNEEEVLNGDHLRHKLKFTNMGRTPAHILRYQIGYSNKVNETDTGLHMVETVNRPEIEFDRLLAGNDSIEVREIDVSQYIRDSIKEIGDSNATGIVSGQVKYQHVFSETDVVELPFIYLYVPSAQQLRRVPLRKLEKCKGQEQSTG